MSPAQRDQAILDFVLIACAVLLAMAFVLDANGQDVRPSGKWRLREDVLARVVVAEADGSQSDWAAILWTLDHRLTKFGDTPERTMLYSSTIRSKDSRPKTIHDVRFADANPMRRRQLVTALEFVKQWIGGTVLDPCPESLHWHGIDDARPGWFVPIECGVTKNSFGIVKRR